MKYISSKKNDLVQKIKYLHTKKGRDELSLFIVEGEKLSNEAIMTFKMDMLILSETFFDQHKEYRGYDHLIVLKDNVFDHVSDTVKPQGIIAVIKKPQIQTEETSFELLAEDVQDPGNLGTMIRTCESFGIQTINLSSKCVDEYNLKTVRSSMGSVLRMKFYKVDDVTKFLLKKKNEGFKLFAGHLNGDDVNNDFSEHIDKAILIIGNESSGVSPEVAGICDKLLKIPIYGQNESLNASVAAGILLNEIRKRFNTNQL